MGDRLTQKFNVWVVGAGHVGLVTGACLARVGHRVTPADSNAGRVAEVGSVPIYEPGLGGILHSPLPRDDPKRPRPDITRVRESLGWEPRVPARNAATTATTRALLS